MNSDFNQPLNLGNPQEFTILELAELVKKLVGVEVQIKYGKLPVDDPHRRCPDIRLAREILDWQPQTELNNGILQTIDWFRSVLS
jgi:nucleoside-diphosphate-sugar epimerase